ncbi:MBL fold metallo-hydrolase [Pseudoduganella eburnea]|uniref:MBL fold metallo-hydrolase n=1 Tax=Massilia eburnea TaxID=1776165 RepID=A0A6L6QIS0_9BURK|nr:MBL fold metallo-hydrolase [Massilia eburnea]MTW12282.1 MBL fold metallo-hydrolase [Massilia eburnea]
MNSPTVPPLAARAKTRPRAPQAVAEPHPHKQAATEARLRIRLYRHGLGDCILLRFAKEGGFGTCNVLIDCGLITVADQPKEKMQAVAHDIRDACNGHLDVVVMTHEHWDHASGFHSSQARDVFDAMEIGEVWYAWTEDPRNELGQRLRAERAAKVNALATAVAAFTRSASPGMRDRGAQLGRLLGFFGLKPGDPPGTAIGKTRDAFEYLQNKQDVKTRYLSPKQAPRLLDGAANVRVYVLGPPPDEGMIKRSTPTKTGREVYELASELQLASNLDAAFLRLAPGAAPAGDSFDDCPFDPGLRRQAKAGQRYSPALADLVSNVWQAQGEDWRKIEEDWTQAAETLALNLDSHTNNTCLVLAFEFTDTGEVMLFPADAQVGNWLSWQDLHWKVGENTVTGPDLLSRTVFYKVGHHGSHNATLRDKGLEQMTSEDLVAFIPVNKGQAIKNRWMGMPFNPLVARLKEKTFGRLLVADEERPSDASLTDLSPAARKLFKTTVEQQELWFEVSIK